MKVAQLLFSGLGGHASVAFSIVEASQTASWHNFLMFYGNVPLAKEYSDKANFQNIQTFAILKNSKIDIAGNRKCYKMLMTWQPDVVLLHSIQLIVPAKRYCVKMKAKLIAIDHTNNSLKSRIDWFFAKLSFKYSDHFVVLSETFKRAIEIKFGKKDDSKIVVIPNGINEGHFFPIINKEQSVSIKLGMLSRINKIKDHVTLLHAFKLSLDTYHSPLELHIAGDGDSLSELKLLSTDLKISDQVFFHGHIDEEQCAALLRSVDIYIHASFGEALSTSILQAMATRLPIIASDVEGINNMLTHKKNAWLVPVQDAESLSNAICKLALNPELQFELAQESYNTFKSNYTMKSMFDKYNMLIQ